MAARNRLFYGGDYNPDQWLDRPDILEKDIEMMKDAGINEVSIGIFAWARLEPEDGTGATNLIHNDAVGAYTEETQKKLKKY